jgi:uncharacterized glyoxalase superfamily protein PhnB
MPRSRSGDSVLIVNNAMQSGAGAAGGSLPPNAGVDKTIAKAVKAGATLLVPAQDMFWADRFGRVEDLQGNRWGTETHREDVTLREMKSGQNG